MLVSSGTSAPTSPSAGRKRVLLLLLVLQRSCRYAVFILTRRSMSFCVIFVTYLIILEFL